MQDVISDAMERLLDAVSSPAEVRRIEDAIARPESTSHRQSWSGLWDALLDSGFVDALVPESEGGSGLDLLEVFPLALIAGRYALPLPIIHTTLVRGMLSSAQSLPTGPIAIAGAAIPAADGSLSCPGVPFGRVADWVLVPTGGSYHLLPTTEASIAISDGSAHLDADMQWKPARGALDALNLRRDGGAPEVSSGSAAPAGCATHWHAVAACAHSALLAGAMQRVLEMTVAYASERSQFGKPIGRFQAIQQQLSVMAEEVFAAKMASQIGFSHAAVLLRASSPSSVEPQALQAIAVAKARTSSAVPTVSAIAHAVHGAIGFTEEYDLQIYTRRLHEMRIAYGAESFWHRRLGDDLIRDPDRNTIDFIRF